MSNLLHDADDDVVIWWESTATEALANNNWGQQTCSVVE